MKPLTILRCFAFQLFFLSTISIHAQAKHANHKPYNVVFILADDHRYDFIGLTGKVPWLETPAMDKIAREGFWIKNATVTTALCSPSRASILTGQYAHTHTVVDNFSPLPPQLVFFPQYLQKAGYQTSFFGKWHMGNQGDQPQKGFNHWESFKGQGVYYGSLLNINGKRVQYDSSVYITDLLTEHAIVWMKNREKSKPFFIYLSHKGVHDNFLPSKRHKGSYAGKPINYPSTINLTACTGSILYGDTMKSPTGAMARQLPGYNVKDIPKWVTIQRNSWHGVDFLYDGTIKLEDAYRKYCETIRGIDESIASVIEALKKEKLDQNTVIIYMGDNGFLWGEHGLIDKRNMYEESQKVPLLVYGPPSLGQGRVLEEVIQNIDIAPTILEMAGIKKPSQMQGQSFLPILQAKKTAWRNQAFYEYYWEFSFPQTPTTFGVRRGNYKFIFYHGIWDNFEFYDLSTDPEEKNNLYRVAKFQPLIKELRAELWNWLQTSNGLSIPLKKIEEIRYDWGYKGFL